MHFKYTATNSEGKTLKGTINAEDETHARSQLNDLGFSILELKKIESPENESGGKNSLGKFAFESTDKSGKKIVGRIPAANGLMAYKRLIEEYGFNVTFLAPENASDEEKNRMRNEGLETIKKQYEIQTGKNESVEKGASQIESPEFLEEKNALAKQVDEMIKTIKIQIAQLEGKLSPEKRSQLEADLNKLLRIKDSNNLDYVRHTCQEILEKLETPELFTPQMEHHEERKKLLLESQKMQFELTKSGIQKPSIEIKLKSVIRDWEEKIKTSKWRMLSEFIQGIENLFEENPEISSIKNELKTLRTQKWDGILMTIKASQETRKENWENVKIILREEKQWKEKLNAIRKNIQSEKRLVKGEHEIVLLEELNAFTGWLLSLYLIHYFLGHYITTNGLSWKPFLGIPFDLKDSVLFKYLLIVVFLTHAATSLKLNFFIKNSIASGLLLVSTIVLTLITLFNF